ncbi:hypothetical protein N7468_006831 [Penicillium chermesinum]|uniref:MARVEL domain-containing protein n=1 Tax=Penicillium chermesinum TaxID=63820 RepID=A0A9W9TJZ0_9EURO|nr:uncharacterized protein N7468_006831 [Penicillium chermesinum]KAJ5225606.1 hypothetical protein N7468_006831 [Penicillium chermesinum]KAJ6161174.1 hypothetical protein N7470_004570 [Penicillium chermesinum]
MRSKPSDYPPIPFYIIRFWTLLSSILVSIILAVFISHLHSDGYKLPIAFLVLLVAGVLSLINAIISIIINCGFGLSPGFSLFTNVLLTIIWAAGLGLESYGMWNTILTSCTTEYWGNSTGVQVCELYKTLFAFSVIGTAAHLASLIFDVFIRRRVTRLGAYGLATTVRNVEPEDQMELTRTGLYSHSQQDSLSSAVPYDSAAVPPMAGALGHHDTAYSSTLEHERVGEALDYYDNVPMPQRGRQREFDHYGDMQDHPQQTAYEPLMYR